MTKVFIGGSRRINRLSADVVRRLENIVQKRLPVVIGDADGADKAVQDYLRGKQYDLVEVLCAGKTCRNNLGNWSVRTVSANGARRGFSFYATKDRVMAEDADCGLMVWDGKSVGTLMNVFRLTQRGKPVAVYSLPEHRFVEFKSPAGWQAFISGCPADLRARIEREVADEARLSSEAPREPDALQIRAGAPVPQAVRSGRNEALPRSLALQDPLPLA